MLSSSPAFKALITASSLFALVSHAGAQDRQPKPDFIDKHTVIVIDNSNSIDSKEEETILLGLREAFISPEAQDHFSSTTRHAVTFVYFSDKAKNSETYIIRDIEDAKVMIDEVIWDLEKDVPRKMPDVGSGTVMSVGLERVSRIYDSEISINIQSIDKTVVVMADDPPNDDHVRIRELTKNLGTQYNATVYGIPIVPSHGSLSVSTFFDNHVKTPAGLKFKHSGGFETPIRKGLSVPAHRPEQVTYTVSAALNLNGF